MTAVLGGTITATCVDCGTEREIQARNDNKIAQRCRECGKKYRSRNTRHVLPPLKAPKNGFSSTHPEEQPALACREYGDLIGRYEVELEHHGHSARYTAVLVDARIDAAEICRDCPIIRGCRRAAKAERYTGIAGGLVFKNGKEVKS